MRWRLCWRRWPWGLLPGARNAEGMGSNRALLSVLVFAESTRGNPDIKDNLDRKCEKKVKSWVLIGICLYF